MSFKKITNNYLNNLSTNIKIDNKKLDKNILAVRYINGRKLTNNKIFNQDYKISNNLVNSIKYNNNINKLSDNEIIIYTKLKNLINKDDIQKMILSYKAGNHSDKLLFKILKILSLKLKNNIIDKKEFYNIISDIL